MSADPVNPLDTDDRTEYDRFHDLLGRLVKVPKKELDEARERDRLAKG
jgi:hypothetical protein